MSKKWVRIGVILLASAIIFSGGWVLSAKAQDQTEQVEPSGSVMAPEGIVAHTCTIANLAATIDRFHVRCTTAHASYPGVVYFAASNDADNIRSSNEMLVLLNTAFSLGKTVDVYFDTNSANNPPGCQVNDCRKLTNVLIYP